MRVNISSILLVCLTAIQLGALAVPTKNGGLTSSIDNDRNTTAVACSQNCHGTTTIKHPVAVANIDKRATRKKASSSKSRPKKSKKTKPKKSKKKAPKASKTRPKNPKTPKATGASKTKTKKPKKPKATQSGVPAWKSPVPSVAEITRHCRVPKDKALFWSRTAAQVKLYRAQTGLTTDSQAYPKGYTSRYRGKDQKKDALFAKRFSIAFAKKAAGVVHLMVPWEGGPPAERVFHKDEWPILKRNLKRGVVTKIIQVSCGFVDDVRSRLIVSGKPE